MSKGNQSARTRLQEVKQSGDALDRIAGALERLANNVGILAEPTRRGIIEHDLALRQAQANAVASSTDEEE